MAKIDGPDPLVTGLVPGLSGRKPEKKKETAKAGFFSSLLKQAERADSTPAAEGEPFVEAEVAELLDAVHSSGDDLKHDANMENIKAYKRAVRNFIHYVVERAYVVEERVSGRNVLKRKKFTSIAVIDEKLERLAADVLSSQKDRLDILRRLDEIHGLLVDLLR
ncbi:MAG: DUF327 family protein [Spirochaetales bacterium]|nr:MAG: DUF327 family protein [Spirochaetales bacterium]